MNLDQYISGILRTHNVTKTEFAESVGLTRQSLRNFLADRNDTNTKTWNRMAIKLAEITHKHIRVILEEMHNAQQVEEQ